MTKNVALTYDDASVKSLDWREHIRLRPGMYIGKLGDGSNKEDGIYVLIKEIVDNAIDEHMMGHGKVIEINVSDKKVTVRDYGRGIPLGKVIDCVSKINTGAKYDSGAFQKSVGLNGVGTKAVNALSHQFEVRSYRQGKMKHVRFERGILVEDNSIASSQEHDGTFVMLEPDEVIFKHYTFVADSLVELMWYYAFLNKGLIIKYNGKKYVSKNGLHDMLTQKIDANSMCYPIAHLKGNDIEVAITHARQYGEEYYSFVNGQHTTQGGTHLAAFREGLVKAIRNFYKKDFDVSDIRIGIIGAVAIRVQEPVFESQTKTKLGSTHLSPHGASIRSFVVDFVAKSLEIHLHQHAAVAEAMRQRIRQSEQERKEIAGIKKIANERAKKTNIHNKKLRDCRLHLNVGKDNKRKESTIFITEGDSASGSITKSRDVQTQAVFSLRGKPLNCFGLSKKIVYENEEFSLLQHALNVEKGLEGLRFNRIVFATDADIDGMHIRLLLLTFFLQFFPDLVRRGHVFVLETPLFRVRNKKRSLYCYSEDEKQEALLTIGDQAEITRFKGLGEISPEEFKQFIGKRMKLQPVTIAGAASLTSTLSFYMGKNTPERQEFIIRHLRVEEESTETEKTHL